MATEYKRLDNNGLLYLLTLLKGEIDDVVPTKTSDLTNDGDGTSNFATEDYVDENGGKIDVIKVNGETQTITNKTVDIETLKFLTSVHDETQVSLKLDKADGLRRYLTVAIHNDSDIGTVRFEMADESWTPDMDAQASVYTTTKADELLAEKTDETQVQEMIDDALADITGVDFVLVDTLPATGEKGKIYLVPNGSTGSNVKDEYIWLEPTGATPYFEKIGSTDIDLSGYVQASEMHALTNAEIDTIFQQVFGS